MKQRGARSGRAPGSPRPGAGSVRIIGGTWRGSRLPVADFEGLRPSSDRQRETLFNWLQARVPGSRCLDLFAGSGALGLEAASRGAASVVLVERDRQLAAGLRAVVDRLRAKGVEVVQADALPWLGQPGTEPFDLVFLDPPFTSDHWAAVFAKLAPLLAPSAMVYVEHAVGSAPVAPAHWQPHRNMRSRDAAATLYRVGPGAADTLQA